MSELQPPVNGSPWGIVAYIAKKDGVIGVFLIALCVFIWLDKKSDREDRREAQALQKVMFDSLAASQRREAQTSTAATKALETSTEAIGDNTKVLQRVERRLPRRHGEDG